MTRKPLTKKFNMKQSMGPDDYLKMLISDALRYNIMTKKEIETLANLKLSPIGAVHALETIVQFKESKRLEMLKKRNSLLFKNKK